jgi:hypothetical protein
MTGNFNVTTLVQGAGSQFIATLNVWPPAGYAFVTASTLQNWISFAGWDTSVATVTNSSVNAVVSNAVTVTGPLVTVVPITAPAFSCGTGALSGQTKSASVVGSNTKCVTNFVPAGAAAYIVDPSGATTNWMFMNTVTRNFAAIAGGNALALGQSIGWTTGFYLWTSATANTLAASGAGSQITWILTDGSSALAMSAAAVALLTLSF